MPKCTMCKSELITKGEKNNAKCNHCHAAYMQVWRENRKQESSLKLEDYIELQEW